MALSTSSEFDGWLSDFLDGLDVDGEVYGGYIGGTLRTLEWAGPDEVEEALSDILSGCLEDDSSCTAASKEIVGKWQLHLSSIAASTQEEPTGQPTTKDPLMLAPMDTLMLAPHTADSAQDSNDRTAASITGVELTTAEKRQLVAMYGCEEEEEDDEETKMDPGGGKAGGGTENSSRATKERGKPKGGKEGGRGKSSKDGKLLQKNTNASSVTEADKKRREQEKVAHAAKVEKDRKSREEQRQKQQERKEKEKKRTQKGERRR